MNRFPHLMALFLGGVMGAFLLHSLSGCVVDMPDGSRLVSGDEAMGVGSVSDVEMGRFVARLDAYGQGEEAYRYQEHFADALDRVRRSYVRDVPDSVLIDAAIKGIDEIARLADEQSAKESEEKGEGDVEPIAIDVAVATEAGLDAMLESLDPHSSYLNADELREIRITTKGEFGGLGIEVQMDNGVIRIVSPIEDTPAFRAGLKSGDLITHLDGEPVKGKSLIEAVRVMRGKPGSIIELTVEREGWPAFDVTIRRAVIKVHSVRWRDEGDIGYVRVTSFTGRVEAELEDAMANLRERMGSRLKGMVLDLRANPGGLLDQALYLSDSFLDDGEIVSVRGRDPRQERSYTAHKGDLARQLPMVVLIDGGSASASEIVAGALQDHHRATVMGQRSFGKGSVQTIIPLYHEGALRLTTDLYYTPSGRAIQALGVDPDVVIIPAVPEGQADKAHAGGDDSQPEKQQTTYTREADLPGAIAPLNGALEHEETRVAEQDCPPAGEDGKDLMLGCARAWLNAGSAAAFLAAIRPAGGA